jgi:hypothetical protein
LANPSISRREKKILDKEKKKERLRELGEE